MTTGGDPTNPSAYDPAGITPDVDDVGRLLIARTIDESGAEVGTFTSSTRPANDEVDALIAVAVQELLMMLDIDTLAADQIPQARFIAAVRAAVLVEGSYFPEASMGAGSWRATLEAMFEAGVAALTVGAHGGVRIF